jgi:hypothetical protein
VTSTLGTCEAVASSLRGSGTVPYVQGPASLSEGRQDFPLAQVYWNGGETDVRSDSTAQTTFGGHVRQHQATVVVDVYVKQRNEVGSDMAATITTWDLVQGWLDSQKQNGCFGIVGAKGFRWVTERVLFEEAGQTPYVGFRVTITLRFF